MSYVSVDIFSVEYLFTRSGSYLLSAIVDLAPIKGCPVNLTVNPSVVCAANTYLSGASLSVFYAGTARTFSIIAMDDFGNKLTSGGSLFAVTIKSKLYTTYTAADMFDGTYQYSVMLTKSGSFFIEVSFSAVIRIKSTPVSCTCYPASSPDPATTIVSGAALRRSVANAVATFIIEVRDMFSNRMSTSDQMCNAYLVLQKFIPGQTLPPLGVKNDSPGIYASFFQATAAGSYFLNINLQVGIFPNSDFFAILNSPFIITVVADAASMFSSHSFGNFLSFSTAGFRTKFFVSMRDFFGNEQSKPDEGIILSAALFGPQFGVEISIDRSVYPVQVEYTITIAGTYKCSVFMNGLPILGSPFHVAVSPATSSQRDSIVQGDGLFNNVAGDRVSVFVSVNDLYGNSRTFSSESVVLIVRNTPSSYFINIGHNGVDLLNRYTFVYTITSSGFYAVTEQLDGLNSILSPYMLYVSPGLSLTRSGFVTGSGVVAVVAGYIARFRIYATDTFGNAKSSGQDNVNVLIDGTSNTATPLDGYWEVSYTASQGPHVTISVTFNDEYPAKYSPYSVLVNAVFGSTCASLSSVDGVGLSLATAGALSYFLISSKMHLLKPSMAVTFIK